MLVDLNATTLKEHKQVVKLFDFTIGYRNKIPSRDVNVLIEMARKTLKAYNPNIHPGDIETVYQEKDKYTLIGAVVCDGNLIGSCDPKATVNHFHIDDTMVIFTLVHTKIAPNQHWLAPMLHVPDNQMFKDVYFDIRIFLEYLIDESRGPAITVDNAKSTLMPLLQTSAAIVKGTTKLTKREINVLRDLLNAYGRFIINADIAEDIPTKYILSDKWFKQVEDVLCDQPYFIARHIWRCYFRLCKEGARFND